MARTMRLLLSIIYLLSIFPLLIRSDSSLQSFVYGGCSQIKYTPGSPYESNLNSLLTSLVNSATYSSYNKYSVMGSSQQDIVYGLYQCRGDLALPDCATCVAQAVSQIGNLCSQTCVGAMQLQGCFVKYDNTSFIGVEDKTVVSKKCGQSVGVDEDAMDRRDTVLAGLVGAGGLYRVGGAQDVQFVAQCVGDLSIEQCQDCLMEAIGRLKNECVGAIYGDVFLGKCYVRYSTSGDHALPKANRGCSYSKFQKKFTIIVGLSATVSAGTTLVISIKLREYRKKTFQKSLLQFLHRRKVLLQLHLIRPGSVLDLVSRCIMLHLQAVQLLVLHLLAVQLIPRWNVQLCDSILGIFLQCVNNWPSGAKPLFAESFSSSVRHVLKC